MRIDDDGLITGLDYFGARYFSGAMGRFTSPDAPFNDQHLEDPQSWNLYAYGRNNRAPLGQDIQYWAHGPLYQMKLGNTLTDGITTRCCSRRRSRWGQRRAAGTCVAWSWYTRQRATTAT